MSQPDASTNKAADIVSEIAASIAQQSGEGFTAWFPANSMPIAPAPPGATALQGSGGDPFASMGPHSGEQIGRQ